ncbi:MAG: AhpC/TSA family protein [Pedobacter sp.]|nr:MAG: AhpC/TSA family protein [Pedobacter sp.]
MKIFALTLFLAIIILPGFSQNVVLNGEIIGLTEKKLLFTYRTETGMHLDTLQVKNGKFTWTKTLSGAQWAMLWLPDNAIPFFIEPGNINVKANIAVTDSLIVTGSKTEDSARVLYRVLDKLVAQRNIIDKKIDTAPDAEKPSLRVIGKEIDLELKRNQHAYLKTNPSSVISLNLANFIATNEDYEEGIIAFDYLSKEAKMTKQGLEIAEELAVKTKSRIGAIVPDFIQNDPSGNPIKFADFRGRYVYIDFWASWCIPCRNENPNVLKAYEKFKNKNFAIIGVSIDNDLNSWKKAIEDDKMPWTMVSDLKGSKNEIATYFGIRGVPSTLLIDPSGKIIAWNLNGNKLHHKLDELFSEQ